VRIYPHPHNFEGKRMDANGKWIDVEKEESFVESWASVKELGWSACKSGILSTPGGIIDPSKMIREGIEKLAELRDAVGEDFEICIDVHGRATPPMAVEFCRRAEEFHPMFVEEATQPEDLVELAHLREHTSVPLATGERLVTRYEFAEICYRRLVDFVQPDVIHCGGILEMRKIADLADTFGIQLTPHNPQSRLVRWHLSTFAWPRPTPLFWKSVVASSRFGAIYSVVGR